MAGGKVDENKCRSLKHQAEKYSETIEKIVDSLVRQYNKDLDDFMAKVKAMLDKNDHLTNDEIENITLRVPVYMYWASNGLETLGIQGDNAKAIKMEAYNNAVMSIDGTIRDKESYAENATLNEYLVDVAFSRAYKKLKTKLDMAVQLCQASRKVLQKRIAEIEIHQMEPNYVKNNNIVEKENDDNE